MSSIGFIEYRSGARLPRAPLWSVIVVASWLGLVAIWEFAVGRHHPDSTVCLFRNVTGIPCATCGTTRAAYAAAKGNVLEAVAMNPFVSLAAIVGVLWLSIRLCTGRTLVFRTSGSLRWIAWSVLLLAFLANWAYVIWRDIRL